MFVRGADPRFTAVFIDGVRVDSQSTGGVTWNVLPLAQIGKKEASGSIAWFDPAFFPQFELSYFEPAFWQQQGLVTGHSSGRNTVWFVQQQGKQAVLRHYYRGGLVGKLNKDIFWPQPEVLSRAMAEFRLLWQMWHWGLPVPRPCAAHYQRRNFGYSADILIERIEGATDLAQLLLQQALKSEQWQQVGAMIARFHRHGVFHSDLNCHNLLLDAQGRAWIVDFDKCGVRPGDDWKPLNLERLLHSLRKEATRVSPYHWTDADWPHLVAGYRHHPANP